MATTTPNYGWPVPTSTDLVKDGATAIEALGDAIDATVFGLPSSGMTLISTTTIGTTVSSVTVSGAFSATYDNYKILISGGVGSADNMGGIQLGATTTGYYNQVDGAQWNNTPFSTGSTTGTVVYCFTHMTNGISGEMEIRAPFLSTISMISSSVAQGTSRAFHSLGLLDNTTSYTDFTLIPTTGTLTGGTIRVYGYQN
jgi:hypothetical protein